MQISLNFEDQDQKFTSLLK